MSKSKEDEIKAGVRRGFSTAAIFQYKSLEGLAPVTVSGYERDLKLRIEYQGNMDVGKVEATHILAYLNYLRTDYAARNRFEWILENYK